MEAIAERSAPSATVWAVEVSGLVRAYGSSRALRGLDLCVPWDQRLAILGANGAGKTTLLRILATLARPTAGQVALGGLALPDQAAAVRRYVGFVGHRTFLYDELTARENLIFYGRLYGVSDPRRRAGVLLDRVGAADRADDRVRSLSRGLQQRVALARAIVHDPPILLLDEPDTGLDVTATDLIEGLLLDERGERRTVLLTSHNLERALDLVDRVVVLSRGRAIGDLAAGATTPSELATLLRDEGRAR